MEGQGISGSGRPGTQAGLGPLPMPHGISQTGAPSKMDSCFQLPAKENAAPVRSEPRLALTPVGPPAAVPPSSKGPRLALASPRPILAPMSTPGGQKTAPAHRSSSLAPTSVGQLVMSASARPKPPPATLGPRLAPLSRDQKQVPPASMGPKPALAASGLSLAVASEKQPPQPPSSSSPVPSPVLSPSQEQALTPASMTSAPASVGWTPAKQRDAPVPRPLSPSDGHLQPPTQTSGPTLPLDVGQGPPEPGTRSPGLLYPTFRPGAPLAQTVPPPLPKPPRSPSRSPSRSPNCSPCVPPAPGMALPRPGTQGAGSGGHLSPNLQPRETPAPLTTSSSTSTSITVVTWNVGTAMPPDDVTSLLHLGSSSDDSDRADMIAIGLQEVNSMINKRLKDALFTDQWSELFMDALGPFNFVLVSTVRMQGVILLLFANLVFWFGDLNFRIESYDLHFVKFAIDSEQLHQLWEKDQLNMAKNTWPILRGFQEGPLNFAPTFKFDVGTNKYDTSPSGRESHRLQVTQHSYHSHMEYTVSDHKPVAAQFVLHFAFRDDVPLVRLDVADEWARPEQAVVRYRIETVGFRHCKDYVAYVWAKHEDVDGNIYQVTFSEESLPKGHGDFILGYYSHTHSILIGVTEPFQSRRLPRVAPNRGSDGGSQGN
ncbi:hypothetical protein E2I00_009997, partial [Balaenoptera physalus]